MLLDDPFAVAADKARPLGVCPINMPDDLHTDHWDHDSLCSGLTCGECVATPEDFGYEHWWGPGDPDEELPIPFADSEVFEIGF